MTRTRIYGAIGGAVLVAALSFAITRHFRSTPQHHIGEDIGVGLDPNTADTGPVRMGHVAYKQGDVAWRPNEKSPWSNAAVNVPMRQGAQVGLKRGSRADVQFDDGSSLRLGGGAMATLHRMYSDPRGEYSEIKVVDGLASMHCRNKLSVYQLDTPYDTIRAAGPADFRVGVGREVETCVRQGEAEIISARGDEILNAGQACVLQDPESEFQPMAMPAPDTWDQFDQSRNVYDDYVDPNVPQNIGLVAGDLGQYGDWHQDASYGQVWCPRVSDSNWRPYSNGDWVWSDPVGYTWVDNEPWGWAPSHYGTWVHESYGWGWCPGPASQYWSPAVVNFTECQDRVAWAPLAPCDVRYPSALNIGFSNGDWAVNFSIGGVANYYPVNSGYCEARPWGNRYVNETNFVNVTNVYNVNNVYNGYADTGFIPYNSRNQWGTTVCNRNSFLDRGGYSRPLVAQTDLFRQGRYVDWRGDRANVAGPWIRPDRSAFTPSRTLLAASSGMNQMLQRDTFRTPMNFAHNGGQGWRSGAANNQVVAGAGRFQSGVRDFSNRMTQGAFGSNAGVQQRDMIAQNRFRAQGQGQAFGQGSMGAGQQNMIAQNRFRAQGQAQAFGQGSMRAGQQNMIAQNRFRAQGSMQGQAFAGGGMTSQQRTSMMNSMRQQHGNPMIANRGNGRFSQPAPGRFGGPNQNALQNRFGNPTRMPNAQGRMPMAQQNSGNRFGAQGFAQGRRSIVQQNSANRFGAQGFAQGQRGMVRQNSANRFGGAQ